MTSLAFMFVLVPAPPCTTSTTNCSCSLPPLLGPGRRQQLSYGGGLAPRWRKDCRELSYCAPSGRMMAVTLGLAPGRYAAAPRELFALPGGPALWDSSDLTTTIR